MVDTCTCQNNCGACGPTGTGCSCAKDKCNCQNCGNHASEPTQQNTSSECACTKAGNKCTCGQ
ncbi:hypothetical protein K466DRAFT_501686 [Polyporus arcularius HHB13444]|uniref:Metallothionein n=1 Tax=Polyporus arcularius HHB13444 TaxID=1314778 RepID=A0A5C3NY50_9APHY|nr:hypothetical protein K466DRAFT_501686 [Polyporus arcularius HHB13444]